MNINIWASIIKVGVIRAPPKVQLRSIDITMADDLHDVTEDPAEVHHETEEEYEDDNVSMLSSPPDTPIRRRRPPPGLPPLPDPPSPPAAPPREVEQQPVSPHC